ncbi:MAG: glutamyl-tRNA reductase [Gammaproteobacteria bacterium]|nr:glutamyl-tRNA reductase [Gammaproteobacteria bacterium]MBQ0839558.1 glutamyl-tRNA reductase [Gammaproteobacteria bacterium]
MPLIALGINHRTASLDVRERVAFAPDQMILSLQQGRDASGADNLAILSTCNRTELYATGSVDHSALLAWLEDHHHLPANALDSSYYVLKDDKAVQHMMKVASGLDSMVLGEPQILGQMKSSYAVAQKAGTADGLLSQVFQGVFATAKRVRSETAIGQNPVSVAYAAVSLAQRIFSAMKEVTALLIGAGETVELLARHLREQGVGDIIVANRTLARAQEMAEIFSAEAILLADIPAYLHRADIVISSTASQLPILGKGAVESALKQRKHRPIFMVDIAVPRDIEPQVAQLDDVYLYTVDDLKEVIEANLRHREDAAGQAEAIIEQGVGNWQNQLRGQQAVGTIRAFRDNVGALRDVELDKALASIAQGQSAEQVLRQLAHGLTNKFLHVPTTRLKRAGEQGDSDYIRWTHDLFDLPATAEVAPAINPQEAGRQESTATAGDANTDVNTRDEQ